MADGLLRSGTLLLSFLKDFMQMEIGGKEGTAWKCRTFT